MKGKTPKFILRRRFIEAVTCVASESPIERPLMPWHCAQGFQLLEIEEHQIRSDVSSLLLGVRSAENAGHRRFRPQMAGIHDPRGEPIAIEAIAEVLNAWRLQFPGQLHFRHGDLLAFGKLMATAAMAFRVKLPPLAHGCLLDEILVIVAREEHVRRHRLEAESLARPVEPQRRVAVGWADEIDFELGVILRSSS